ncbi:ribonuclease H-like domain-containing protein [Trametes meyenii]|nr:ribonuclease H-like domain-containing protein [Trametes meyenii]
MPSTRPRSRIQAKSTSTARDSDTENYPGSTTEAASVGETASVSTARLPLYSYEDYKPSPAVVYTPDEEEANELVQCLRGSVVGFDLEWVFHFRRGGSINRRTALVQLSDAHMILLIQVNSMKKFPHKLKELIENKAITKLGANIKQDGWKLFRDFGILAKGLVELGALAREADPSFSKKYRRSVVSLARVVEKYTGKTLDKGPVRTSNWENYPLTQAQKFYAANDAHCALMVYNRLTDIATQHGITLNLEAYCADLAEEYQTKIAATARKAAASSIDTSSADPTVSPDDGLLSTTEASGPAATKPDPRFYARPLVYATNADALTTPTASASSSASSTNGCDKIVAPQQYEQAHPQHIRAYKLWQDNCSLSEICAKLRSKDNPLAHSTVISYVVAALQSNPKLSFDMDRLKSFVQLEIGSWERHRDWILRQDGYLLQ